MDKMTKEGLQIKLGSWTWVKKKLFKYASCKYVIDRLKIKAKNIRFLDMEQTGKTLHH